MKTLIKLLSVVSLTIGVSSHADDKTFIDYFLPTPIIGTLTTNTWGAPGILPRDPQNGLEDQSLKDFLTVTTNAQPDDAAKKWYYWDGQIIKSPTGKYYMFASRWDQSKGHGGWGGSSAIYAISDNLFGPYVDKGFVWPDVINGVAGRGHNVTALVLPDGRYAVLISETRPGSVYISKSLDGPWDFQGPITFSTNQFSGRTRLGSNMSIMVRPDGNFEIVQRSGLVLISTNGVVGPYAVQGPSVYPKTIDGQPVRNLEDPVVWFSGGLYHIVVNSWSARKAYHLTSTDGIHNWTLRGLAYDPTADFVRYADGTVNHWNKMERPGVYIENGHVAAVTLASIDIPKEQDHGNMPHGSKVLVIPFDGAAFDADMQKLASATQPAASTPHGQQP